MSTSAPLWLYQRSLPPLVPISAHLGNPTAPQGAVPPTLGTTALEHRLTEQSYLEFLRNELPGLSEDVPLATRNDMCYQNDGASPHATRLVTQYLKETFPGR
jgi:hypothetical protein